MQGTKNGAIAVESVNSMSVYGGMGIHLVSAPSIVRYINASPFSAERADAWATAIEFFGGVEAPVSRSWAVKGEYSYFFKSYTVSAGTSGDGLHYAVNAPMALVQYVMPGKGYFIKLNAGGGYHWGTVTPPNNIYAAEPAYKASGPGFRLEAEGQTAFDAHLFGYFSATADAEFLGTVHSDGGRELTNGGGPVSLNYFAAGVRFGLMYYF